MAIKRRVTLAELTGTGEVYQGDERLGTAKYRLVIKQQMIDAGSFDEVPGMKEIDGQLWDITATAWLVQREGLMLHLENGGQLPFIVSGGSPLDGNYEIKPSGNAIGIPELDDR